MSEGTAQADHIAPISLRCQWPEPPRTTSPTDFFWGAWHPRATIGVAVDVPSGAAPIRQINGKNWFLAGTALEVEGEERALVHEGDCPHEGFAFRGYLLDRGVDSWSSSDDLRPVGQSSWPRQPNGVFAMARVTDRGGRLELATDLLGVSPLYIRHEDELVLFSNSPRLLSTDGDAPDRIAALSRVNGLSVPGSRSLNSRVHRVSPGVLITHDGSRTESIDAPGLEFLPASTIPIDDRAIERLEQLLHQAIHRCVALPGARRVLGLSSGHDSRRILGTLLRQDAEFEAITVRVLQKGSRDLDARFASEMAREFDFRHSVVDLPRGKAAASMDRDRRELLDAETGLHTWMLPLADRCAIGRSLFIDGFCGDVLGEGGFIDERVHLADAPEAKAAISKLLLNGAIDSVLAPDRWPGQATVRAELERWVESLPPTQFRELAFLLSRSRRAIAPSSQLLMPAGCTTVYPYLDLDYLSYAISLETATKLGRSTQQACLDRFEPAIATFRGSRNVPENLAPSSLVDETSRLRSQLRALRDELIEADALARFRSGLTLRARAQLSIARFADPVLLRSAWWFAPLAEVELCSSLRRPGWRFASPI